MPGKPYVRTPGQRAGDHQRSKEYEQQVYEALGPGWNNQTASTTKLDFWHEEWDVYLDVKEKRQPLGKRWPTPPGVDPTDLFVLDELSVRKALRHYPGAYFLLRDCPGDRLFLASIPEVVCAERIRRNRAGKGKWIINLQNFQRIDCETQIVSLILSDLQAGRDWLLRSPCIMFGDNTVPEV